MSSGLRRRLIWAIVGGWLLNLCLWWSEPAPAPGFARLPDPYLAFSPARVDFGRTYQKTIQTTTVEVTNTSSHTLDIREVEAGCGCTEARLEKTHLEPGEAAQLELSLDTVLMEGRITKTILVFHSLAPDPARLDLTTVVDPLLDIDPEVVTLGEVRPGFPTSVTLTIKPNQPQRCLPVEVTSNAPGLRLGPLRKARDGYTVEVFAAPEGDQSVTGNLSIKTTCPELPWLYVPVVGRVLR